MVSFRLAQPHAVPVLRRGRRDAPKFTHRTFGWMPKGFLDGVEQLGTTASSGSREIAAASRASGGRRGRHTASTSSAGVADDRPGDRALVQDMRDAPMTQPPRGGEPPGLGPRPPRVPRWGRSRTLVGRGEPRRTGPAVRARTSRGRPRASPRSRFARHVPRLRGAEPEPARRARLGGPRPCATNVPPGFEEMRRPSGRRPADHAAHMSTTAKSPTHAASPATSRCCDGGLWVARRFGAFDLPEGVPPLLPSISPPSGTR